MGKRPFVIKSFCGGPGGSFLEKRPLVAEGIKIIFFLLIIFFLQLLVGSFAPGMGFHNLELLDKYLEKPVDIMVFGDSSNWYTAEHDKDKRSISRMLGGTLPGYSIKSITHAAYQLDVYAAFCHYIVRQENRPGIVIIPINMRSFSPEWDREPHYQFEKEKIILEGGLLRTFYKPLRLLKYKFNKISRADYLNTPVFLGGRETGKIKHMKGLKKQFILRYMYSLTDEHRKIESLVRIIKLVSKNNLKILFYITPVDYQVGERYLPGLFKQQLTDNTKFIGSLLSEANQSIPLLDLSMDLTAGYFAWQKKSSPNEHLNREGRRYVAEKLAEMIKKME